MGLKIATEYFHEGIENEVLLVVAQGILRRWNW